ncbi:MAG: hypothetical protein K9H64_21165 [Bacteroidales bacterium]|nr:hypothetical protein [Bacteroidales bacterium]MCF8458537.1 hypothetical protein [Bacteroidales bacterium]
MDISKQYAELTEKINESLPLKAFPIRDLVQIFRKKGHPITLKTELTITSVHSSGDISGIMCTVELIDGYKMACAFTHLIFQKNTALYAEIVDYQKKRVKRIKQLNLTGMN